MKYIALFGVLVLLGVGCGTAPVQQPEAPEPNITVDTPTNGEQVSNPVHVTGEARTFESGVNWRLLDVDGNVLTEGYTTANAPDAGEFGLYEFWIVVPQVSDSHVTIQVFEYSAKDGSMINLVEVPVVLDRTDTQDVSLYFMNNLLDPDITCEKTFPVKRTIVATNSVARAAMPTVKYASFTP